MNDLYSLPEDYSRAQKSALFPTTTSLSQIRYVAPGRTTAKGHSATSTLQLIEIFLAMVTCTLLVLDRFQTICFDTSFGGSRLH